MYQSIYENANRKIQIDTRYVINVNVRASQRDGKKDKKAPSMLHTHSRKGGNYPINNPFLSFVAKVCRGFSPSLRIPMYNSNTLYLRGHCFKKNFGTVKVW